MSLEFLIKFMLTKKAFTPSLEGPRKGVSPIFPTTGPLWKQTPIARALLSISFGISGKGALAADSPHRDPTERDAPSPEPPFIQLSKSPVYDPLSRFPRPVR
jgi:hypothetical protein